MNHSRPTMFSFSQRTINVWNKLSEECVHASSVNMFKNIIDKYLVKRGTHKIRESYTYNSMSRLSISKLKLPCLLPSEVFLGWQSC